MSVKTVPLAVVDQSGRSILTNVTALTKHVKRIADYAGFTITYHWLQSLVTHQEGTNIEWTATLVNKDGDTIIVTTKDSGKEYLVYAGE